MVKFGIILSPIMPLDTCLKMAELAERYDVDYLWVADTPKYVRDVFVLLTAIALRTKRIKLGTGVCNPFTRHPVKTAMALATINESSGGRAVFGVGAGGSDLSTLAIKPVDIVDVVREAVRILRELFAGNAVYFGKGGDETAKVQLSPYIPLYSTPIYVAAGAPKMLRLTGEIGNGVILSSFLGEHLQYALKYLNEGAKTVNRNVAEIDIGNATHTSVAMDMEEARSAVKDEAASVFAGTAPNMLEMCGVRFEEQEAIAKVFRERGKEAAREIVTEKIVDIFAMAGDPDAVTKRLVKRVQSGVTQVIFNKPFGPEPVEGLKIIGEEVIPKVRKQTSG